jgi:hypothetical protein
MLLPIKYVHEALLLRQRINNELMASPVATPRFVQPHPAVQAKISPDLHRPSKIAMDQAEGFHIADDDVARSREPHLHVSPEKLPDQGILCMIYANRLHRRPRSPAPV